MEENQRPIRIIDSRNKQYFVVDDVYLNGFARHLGPIASMVYISLCRHVNKDQYAFPSQETIGNEIGASVRSVKEAIKKLRLWNIIDIKRERTNHRWEKNSYYLLDKSVWKKPSGAGNALDRSGANDDMDQVQEMHTKDTHNKEYISKDIYVASQQEQIPYRDVLLASSKPVRSKGKSNPTIDYLVEYLPKALKLNRLDGSMQNNRRACSNLLRKFTPLEVKEMIDNASRSSFWSDKVRNFQTIFNNASKLLDEKPQQAPSTLQILSKFKPYEKSE